MKTNKTNKGGAATTVIAVGYMTVHVDDVRGPRTLMRITDTTVSIYDDPDGEGVTPQEMTNIYDSDIILPTTPSHPVLLGKFVAGILQKFRNARVVRDVLVNWPYNPVQRGTGDEFCTQRGIPLCFLDEPAPKR